LLVAFVVSLNWLDLHGRNFQNLVHLMWFEELKVKRFINYSSYLNKSVGLYD